MKIRILVLFQFICFLFYSNTASAVSNICTVGHAGGGMDYNAPYHRAFWDAADYLHGGWVFIATTVHSPVFIPANTAPFTIGPGANYYTVAKTNPSDGPWTISGAIFAGYPGIDAFISNESSYCNPSPPGTVTVNVNNTPPVSIWFTPDSTVGVGSTATVHWDAGDASSCLYLGNNIATFGSSSFTATTTTTFSLSCLGPMGSDNYGPLGGTGQGQATLTVVDFCSSSYIGDTDDVAVNMALNAGSSEPWERGASIYCAPSTGTRTGYFAMDSFGEIYTPVNYTVTQDPCQLQMAKNATYNGLVLVGGVHTHPYFTAPSQYTRGVGCHGDTNSPSIATLNQLNLDNRNFGPGDPDWNTQTNTPFYVRVPLANSVKRRSTSGSVTVVY